LEEAVLPDTESFFPRCRARFFERIEEAVSRGTEIGRVQPQNASVIYLSKKFNRQGRPEWNTSMMPESVLDNASIEGLLKMAADEKLLCDRADRGDMFVYGLEKYRVQTSRWHKQQILEQVVLNDRIHSAREIPFDWLDGDFLDLNMIVCSQPTRQVDFQEAIVISPDILEGMLAARGADTDLARYDRVYKEIAGPVLAEIHDFESQTGTLFDSGSLRLQGIVNPALRYTRGYTLAVKWGEIESQLRPVTAVVEEFLSLSNVAEAHSINLKTPIRQQSDNLVNFRESKGENDAIQVFRIATQALGQIPFCETLRETIALAREPETAALRLKIDEWICSLPHGIADRTLKIQTEIRDASECLLKSKKIQNFGYISGIVALPISTVGMWNPFFGALGLGLGCVAVMCEKMDRDKRDELAWFGFGSR
jgi:hypothetical protein